MISSVSTSKWNFWFLLSLLPFWEMAWPLCPSTLRPWLTLEQSMLTGSDPFISWHHGEEMLRWIFGASFFFQMNFPQKQFFPNMTYPWYAHSGKEQFCQSLFGTTSPRHSITPSSLFHCNNFYQHSTNFHSPQASLKGRSFKFDRTSLT